MGYVIGKGGATLKKLAAETGAQVTTPRRGTPNDQSFVTVAAAEEACVARALVRLELLVDSLLSSPKSAPYNYFLSIPLLRAGDEAAQAALRGLHASLVDAARTGAAERLVEAMVVAPERMHLTVCMLKLYSERAREACRQALRRCRDELQALTGGDAMRFALAGLGVMKGGPDSARVVHLEVADRAPRARVQAVADALVARMGEAGLLREGDGGPVRLHATVINTRHAAKPPPGEGGQRGGRRGADGGKPEAVDATGILDEFGDREIAELTPREVHLSRRGEYGEDGYYLPADVVSI